MRLFVECERNEGARTPDAVVSVTHSCDGRFLLRTITLPIPIPGRHVLCDAGTHVGCCFPRWYIGRDTTTLDPPLVWLSWEPWRTTVVPWFTEVNA